MRKSYTKQYRFDSSPIAQVELNIECRDEIICVLLGLQHLYTNSALRMKVIQLVAADINEHSRTDIGRPGMDYWQALVLATVRLGCNLDFDKLQDQVENHRALRGIMGIGEWEDLNGFNYRTMRDTLCLLKPTTINKLNEAIVTAGHALDPQAAETVRADSFVIETNIHFPAESGLILDGIQKLVPLCVDLAATCGVSGWRQISHLVKKIKKQVQKIGRMAASKSPSKKQLLSAAYAERLKSTDINFHKTRLHHSGVESAIGALQRGNGLERCRDRSEIGFERYFGLGVLGRNIHTLGKLLLARNHANSLAATSSRKAA